MRSSLWNGSGQLALYLAGPSLLCSLCPHQCHRILVLSIREYRGACMFLPLLSRKAGTMVRFSHILNFAFFPAARAPVGLVKPVDGSELC